MMPKHAWSHEYGAESLRIIGSAINAWMFCIAAGFILVASRQNFLPPIDDPYTTRLLDAATLAVVSIATAMLLVHRERGSLTNWRILAVGVFWVILSILSEMAYRAFIDDRHLLRFFLRVLMGTSDPLRGWVWQVFLTVQLTALPTLKIMEEAVARLRQAELPPLRGRSNIRAGRTPPAV